METHPKDVLPFKDCVVSQNIILSFVAMKPQIFITKGLLYLPSAGKKCVTRGH